MKYRCKLKALLGAMLLCLAGCNSSNDTEKGATQAASNQEVQERLHPPLKNPEPVVQSNEPEPAQDKSSVLETEPDFKQQQNAIYQEIERWRAGARAGSSHAQVKLAQALVLLYEPQYDLAAFHWLERASQQENDEARYLLGTFYYDGIGTEINYPKAFLLFSELALKGDLLAQCKLGKMYYYGQGTEVDMPLARHWLLSAAQADIEDAKILIALLLKEEIANLDENTQEEYSKEWIEFAANTGQPQALYLKGISHLYGKHGFEQSIDLGMAYILQAAQQNVVVAQRQLGEIYSRGLFGLEDESQAYDWTMIASKNGDPNAQLLLAQMFYTGNGAPVDFIQSYAWSQTAILLGNQEARSLKEEVGKLMDATELAQAKYLSKQYSQQYKSQTDPALSYNE